MANVAGLSQASYTGTGNGTCGTFTFDADLILSETWTVACVSIGPAVFSVTGSVSGAQGTASPGTPYTNQWIGFTLTTGGVAYAVSDTFVLTATSPIRQALYRKSLVGTGTGSIGSFSVFSDPPLSQTWTLTCTNATTPGSEVFSVVGSVSGTLASATVGVAYTNSQIGFKITAGGTNFIVGDIFTLQQTNVSVFAQSEYFIFEYPGYPTYLDRGTDDAFLNSIYDIERDTVGNGAMTDVYHAELADVSQLWTITCTDDSVSGSEVFSVVGSVSGTLASATVGVAYSNAHIKFKITAGATDFVAGDVFHLLQNNWTQDPLVGTFDSSFPYVEGETRTGIILDGAMGHFLYDRLYFTPDEVSMPQIVSYTDTPIYVWVAFDHAISLTAQDYAPSLGLSITVPYTPPHVLQAQEYLAYHVLIDSAGEFTLSSSLHVTADGLDYYVPISGRRLLLFPFLPNWKTPVKETLEWKTDIVVSYSGLEQRRLIRSKPRRSLTYSALLTGQEASRMENLLWGWQNRPFVLPVCLDKTSLTVAANIGDTVLHVGSTTDMSFAAENPTVLYRSSSVSALYATASFTSNTITLSDPLEENWPMGTAVYPGMVARLPKAIPGKRYTSGAIDITVDADFDPGVAEVNLPAEAAPTSYLGYEVLLDQPNWGKPLDHTFNYEYEIRDSETGGVFTRATEVLQKISRRYAWLLHDRDNAMSFRSFIARREGRLVPVWIPTWHLDFKVVRAEASGSHEIKVEDNLFFLLSGESPYRLHIYVRLRNGFRWAAELENVTMDGADTILTTVEAAPSAFSPADVVGLHLLMLNRLESDAVTFSWHTLGVATVEADFVTIPG